MGGRGCVGGAGGGRAGGAAGASLGSETVSFSWFAADPDGDALTYSVAYSTDGGESYETLSVGQAQQRLSLSRSRLAGSARARVRVIASDGTRSTTAESALFTVAANAPRVSVVRPRDGQVFGGPNVVALEASASDSEDGELDASSITWTSSIDGPLATAGRARVHTADLSTGTHVLTATATDSAAMSSSVSVTVTVKDANDPPVAAGDTAYLRPGGSAIVDVAANDTDFENDINLHSLTVVVPPSLGSAAVVGHSSTVAAVEHSSRAAGIDVLVYRICDRFYQCSTAEVTVITLSDSALGPARGHQRGP